MSFLPKLFLKAALLGSSFMIFISSTAYALPPLTSPQPQPSSNNSSGGPTPPNSNSTGRIDDNQAGIVETSTARVALTIVDQNDKPIEKAKVSLDKKEVVTDEAGLAVFSGIQPGKYTVKVNKSGKITSASINVVNQRDMSLTQRFTVRAQTPFKFPYLLAAGIVIITAVLFITYFKNRKSE